MLNAGPIAVHSHSLCRNDGDDVSGDCGLNVYSGAQHSACTTVHNIVHNRCIDSVQTLSK